MKAAEDNCRCSDEDCLKMQQWAAIINKNNIEGCSEKNKHRQR